MTGDGGRHLDDGLARLISGGEPPELQSYLAVLREEAAYHAGSTVPAVGTLRRLPTGLWVPANAQLSSAPIDLIAVYVTFEEVFGQRVSSEEVSAYLRRYAREDLLTLCGLLLRRLQEPGDAMTQWEEALLGNLRPEFQTRLKNLLLTGRPLFTRQGLLALAKLVIVHGAEAADEAALPADVAIGFLVLMVHDLLGSHNRVDKDEPGDSRIGGLPARLSMEVIANNWFNRTLDEANFLALFERRWMTGGRPSTERVAARFRETMGFGIDELSAVALALWAGCRGGGYVNFEMSYLAALDIEEDRLERVLSLITIDLSAAVVAVNEGGLSPEAFDWNFDLFEQYPIVKMPSGRLLVLDPGLLIRRCLGWAPIYDLTSRERQTGRQSEHDMADASAGYAMDVLASMYATGPTRRLYDEETLQGAFGTAQRNADAAVDFGSAWVVFEITARRPIRKFLHGGEVRQLVDQVEIILDEADQIAATARSIRTTPEKLLSGKPTRSAGRIYPVIVMTEGFPSNPITLTEIRRSANERELFAGLDAAPLEVIDLVELEMLESVTELGGPDLPTLLDQKASSNFHADSVRNFLTSRRDLDLQRSDRIEQLFSVPVDRIAAWLKEGTEGPEDHP